jgi:putative FmdB family regulatory protein
VPTYEYRCKDCGTELEVVQAFTDDALTTCESCGGALRKVFGSVGISFKGSGFYKNDSRGSKTGGGGSGSDSSSSDSSSSDSSPSSDSSSSSDSSAAKADKPKDAKPDKGKKADKAKPAAASSSS